MDMKNTILFGGIVGVLLNVVVRAATQDKVSMPVKLKETKTFKSIEAYMIKSNSYKSAGVFALLSAVAIWFASRVAPLSKTINALSSMKFVASAAAGMVVVGFAARRSGLFPDLTSEVYDSFEKKQDKVVFDGFMGVLVGLTMLLLGYAIKTIGGSKALSML